jgi:hypothetical protein
MIVEGEALPTVKGILERCEILRTFKDKLSKLVRGFDKLFCLEEPLKDKSLKKEKSSKSDLKAFSTEACDWG